MHTNTAILEAIGFVLLMAGFMGTGFLITAIMYNLINKQHGNN